MRIALDAMGGDAAPQATVAGAVAAARELGASILLVGDRARLESELAQHRTNGLDIELRHATQVVGMDDSPTAALRQADSSMAVALAAVRDGEAAAFVFAGNTGAGMVLGAHLLGRTPGVERPAIAVLLPSPRGHTILLDAGANVDCRPLHLTQFAVMGDAYARAVRQIAAPRVGLLSNGLEESKGNALVRAAAPLLRQLPINFVGYVEGREVNAGTTDVVVCDGFTGNLVLKSLEGFGQLVGQRLREMFEQSLRTKLAYLLLRRDVARLRQDLDPRETGGALLLGLNGIVVKAHGSSDAHAIRNAVAVASSLAQSGVTQQVASGIAATVGLDVIAEPAATTPRTRRFWNTLRDRLRRERPAAERSDGASPAPPVTPVAAPTAPTASTAPGAPGAAVAAPVANGALPAPRAPVDASSSASSAAPASDSARTEDAAPPEASSATTPASGDKPASGRES
jgi:glycerol-3-phosphate acyltransferase PlsX